MNFVTRTRIVQYADLVGGVQTVLDTPVVFITGPVGTIVLDMPTAMALVPAGQRPAPSEWWKYQLQYLVQAYLVPTVRGVISGTNKIVFDCDFWVDQATRDAGTQAQRRNTFIYQVGAKSDIAAQIVTMIDEYLLRAEFNNYPADGRDPNIQTTTDTSNATDPAHLLTKQAVINADGQFRTIPSSWRTY